MSDFMRTFLEGFRITRKNIDVVDTARINGFGREYISSNIESYSADVPVLGIVAAIATKPFSAYRTVVYLDRI